MKTYPVGFLSGPCLDTAASIGIVVPAGTLGPSLSWCAAMVLPVLFTAGTTAFDSADGLMMSRIHSRSPAMPGASRPSRALVRSLGAEQR